MISRATRSPAASNWSRGCPRGADVRCRRPVSLARGPRRTPKRSSWLAAQDALASDHLGAIEGRARAARPADRALGRRRGDCPRVASRAPVLHAPHGRRKNTRCSSPSTPTAPSACCSTRCCSTRAGSTTLDAWQPSKEGELLAYQISEGGDEESILRVIDVESGAVIDGPIDRCRYSPIGWLPGGQAFYYVRRLAARRCARR